MGRMKERYDKEIVPMLCKKMSYDNVMMVPHLRKIVLNIGIGEASINAKVMEAAEGDLTTITAQHPVVTRAKKSITNFKIRQGMPVGIKVTLRGEKMYQFFDKLVSVALARMREFQGVSRQAFDGRGNYTLGIKEQTIFPEIDYSKIDKLRGMEICIITSARNDEEGRSLLEEMGMPFSKD